MIGQNHAEFARLARLRQGRSQLSGHFGGRLDAGQPAAHHDDCQLPRSFWPARQRLKMRIQPVCTVIGVDIERVFPKARDNVGQQELAAQCKNEPIALQRPANPPPKTTICLFIILPCWPMLLL